jgi:hypothetical protein
VGRVEAKLILEDWGWMRSIAVVVSNLLLDYKVVLVDVGDEGGLVQAGNVDDQVHLSI